MMLPRFGDRYGILLGLEKYSVVLGRDQISLSSCHISGTWDKPHSNCALEPSSVWSTIEIKTSRSFRDNTQLDRGHTHRIKTLAS